MRKSLNDPKGTGATEASGVPMFNHVEEAARIAGALARYPAIRRSVASEQQQRRA